MIEHDAHFVYEVDGVLSRTSVERRYLLTDIVPVEIGEIRKPELVIRTRDWNGYTREYFRHDGALWTKSFSMNNPAISDLTDLHHHLFVPMEVQWASAVEKWRLAGKARKPLAAKEIGFRDVRWSGRAEAINRLRRQAEDLRIGDGVIYERSSGPVMTVGSPPNARRNSVGLNYVDASEVRRVCKVEDILAFEPHVFAFDAEDEVADYLASAGLGRLSDTDALANVFVDGIVAPDPFAELLPIMIARLNWGLGSVFTNYAPTEALEAQLAYLGSGADWTGLGTLDVEAYLAKVGAQPGTGAMMKAVSSMAGHLGKRYAHALMLEPATALAM